MHPQQVGLAVAEPDVGRDVDRFALMFVETLGHSPAVSFGGSIFGASEVEFRAVFILSFDIHILIGGVEVEGVEDGWDAPQQLPRSLNIAKFIVIL